MSEGRINPPGKRPGFIPYGYYRFPDDTPGQVRYLWRRRERGE